SASTGDTRRPSASSKLASTPPSAPLARSAPAAVTSFAHRPVHVVEDRAGRDGAKEVTAAGADRASGADGGVEASFELADGLLVSPVEADARGHAGRGFEA